MACIRTYLLVPAMFVLLSGMSSTQELCRQCDCTISTPDIKEGAILGIKPRCRQGHVTWLNAYGAVRMELGTSSLGDLRVCLRIDSEHVSTVVSQETTMNVPGNYRLKTLDDVEVGLSHVFTAAGRGKEFCISGSGPLRLYLETEQGDDFDGVARVEVQYDVERKSSVLYDSPMEECRPCTDKELLKAFCSSDFVAIGTMDEVTHEEEISHIDVTVTKLISQSESIFKKSTDVWARSQVLKGVVNVPLRCGIRLGEGQFLFTGRVRLGQPVLQCAPRYEQWNTVLDDAVNHGLLECSYG